MSTVLSPVDEYGQDRQIAQLRVPPHSIEGESSVLGGLLLDNAAWDRVGDILLDNDFYRYEHRLIYAAIGALVGPRRPHAAGPPGAQPPRHAAAVHGRAHAHGR